MTDRELITRIVVHNDADAFAVVMQKYSGFIFSTALSITKEQSLAEEVTQLALIKAYKNLHHWRGGTSLAPYLQMIAHNEAIDAIRSRQRLRHSDIDNLQVSDEQSTAKHHHLLDLMDKAIATLTDEEQKVIELHYYQKLKIKEIAALTDNSESNILVKLHRIRTKLKRKIEDEEHQ